MHLCDSFEDRRYRGFILAGQLWILLTLACGGGRTPLGGVDDGQGDRRRRTDSGVSESLDAQAAPAIHVTASTDNPAGIFLQWTIEGPIHPTAYVVRRDGHDLAVVEARSRDLWDTSTESGSLSPITTLSATQGTRTDAVALSWSAAATAHGVSHVYQVIAVEGQTRVVESEEVIGARAAPTLLGYELSRDDAKTWFFVGRGTSFVDTEAPLGTITAPAEATARYPLGYVRLQVTSEPTVVPPRRSSYRVRARTSSVVGPASPPASGFRGVGTVVSYQWQRSAANRDADYGDLADVTGSLWFDDTAPLDETRFFRALMRADGATGVTAGAKALVKRFKSVSVGFSHACAIASDGQRCCWGSNAAGQAPREFSTDTYRAMVASWSREVTCGIREDSGAVDCWGEYDNGDPLIKPPAGPFRVLSIGRASGYPFLCGILTDGSIYCPIAELTGPAQAISAGDSFACAILADGSRVCSGTNIYGQAPPGPSTDKFRSIGTGYSFACGLRTDDTISCWGQISPGWGALASPMGTFKSVSVGANVVCALDSKGKVLCLGFSAPFNEWQAPREAEDAIFAEVSAGSGSACGVRADGKIVCWGSNFSGNAPQPPSKERFASISVADAFELENPNMFRLYNNIICGIRTDGILHCWGASIPIPDDLAAQRLKALSLGSESICGVREDGKLVCWGGNRNGQTPPGPSRESFSAVSMSAYDTCAVATNGKITCWGRNSSGESSPPVGLFTSVSMGSTFGCGLSTEGKILCWGDKQLDRIHPPDGPFTAVSAGSLQACGLDVDHHVVCWGQTGSASPPAEAFKTVSVSTNGKLPQEGLACGVRWDDRVVCWGESLSADSLSRPTLDRFLDVQAGACGIRTDHHLVCWGDQFGF